MARAQLASLRPSTTVHPMTFPVSLLLAQAVPTEPFEGQSMGWMLVKSCFALGLVIALTYLSLNFGLRRMMGLKGGPFAGRAGLVTVIERVPLDPKRSMFVVKAAGEYLLVGGGEDLQLIAKLDPEAVERHEREQQNRPPPQLSPFLQKLLTRRPPPPKAE